MTSVVERETRTVYTPSDLFTLIEIDVGTNPSQQFKEGDCGAPRGAFRTYTESYIDMLAPVTRACLALALVFCVQARSLSGFIGWWTC